MNLNTAVTMSSKMFPQKLPSLKVTLLPQNCSSNTKLCKCRKSMLHYMLKFSLFYPCVLFADCNCIVVIEKSNQVSAVIYILDNIVHTMAPWGTAIRCCLGLVNIFHGQHTKLDPSRRRDGQNKECGKGKRGNMVKKESVWLIWLRKMQFG